MLKKKQKGSIIMKNVLEYLENISLTSKHQVIDEWGQCSYAELLQTSQKVGSSLALKLSKNMPVPIFMEKGIHCLSAFFGTVYAGCFYVLLNPQLPSLRLQQVLQQLQSTFIITDQQHYHLALEYFDHYEILLIEDLQKTKINMTLLKDIRQKALDIDPLYANFTSGSTGTPKGVVVNHISVIHFIEQLTTLFQINDTDIIGNQAPFDFDVSVKDIYSAISTGATLVIIPRRLFSSPAQLLDYLCAQHITTMFWAVSALCLITTFHGLDYKVPIDIKKVLFSGEVMPLKHLKQWMEHLPDAMFVNLYGPTEITCNCTYHIIDRTRDYDALPIGKPFDNKEVFLIDQQQLINKPHQIGEIIVRGIGLSLGYYNDSHQTQKAFIQNPLHHHYQDIVYCTGDLAYYNEKKELIFAGRKDFQIKYMGHRIELEEIEKIISHYVERVCCLFIKNKIYCFYIGHKDKKELHQLLKEQLPIYMIPHRFIQQTSFPLTKNGKIDRKALAETLGG